MQLKVKTSVLYAICLLKLCRRMVDTKLDWFVIDIIWSFDKLDVNDWLVLSVYIF